jgi:GR25 family glycosyltransferase involved in LPS biosynthesis
MNQIDYIFYINLDRRPERNYHFIQQCAKHGLPENKIYRFSAIDAYKHSFSQDELAMFSRADYCNKPFAARIMCNQLSHYYILKQIIRENIGVSIIFQDDVLLKDGFVQYIDNILTALPDDVEILNFSMHEYAAYKTFIPWDLQSTVEYDVSLIAENKINNYICKMRPICNPCSLGYIITLRGARNLSRYFETVGFLRATDHSYNDYLIEYNIFYASNSVLATSNVLFESDVFQEGDTM